LEDRRLLAITVNTLIDEADGSIVDGDASLRDAIAVAPPGETITFSVNGEIGLTLGQIVINKSVSIVGPGAEHLTIDANDASRIFSIDNGNASTNASVAISGLTLTRGRIATAGFNDQGGAIFSTENLTLDGVTVMKSFAENDGGGLHLKAASGGQITIRNSLITGNSSNSAGGGSVVYSPVTGSLLVENSTFSYNRGGLTTSGPEGGGMRLSVPANSNAVVTSSTFSGNFSRTAGGGMAISLSQDALLTMTGLTVSGNQAGRGGGIRLSSNQFADSTTLAHSTITGNRTTDLTPSAHGGGIYTFLSTLALDHTIVAGNQAGGSTDIHNRDSTITAEYSLVGNNTGSTLAAAPVESPDANGNTIGGAGAAAIDARLAPLANVGGRTKVHALLSNSPALDAGDAAFAGPPSNDQRGAPFARVVDGNGSGGARVDIGAFELQPVSAAASLVVTSPYDVVNGDLSASDLSLREAVGLANASAGAQSITFAPQLGGQTIELVHGTIQLIESAAINGLGANLLAIDGLGLARVVSIDDGDADVVSNMAVRDLTIHGGNARMNATDAGDGGGIRSVESTTIERSVVTGNTAAGDGGGMYIFGVAGAVVTISQNEFSENTAGLFGGGLGVGGPNAISVTGNSFVDNTAVRHGGGLLAVATAGGSLDIQDSLISGNDAIAGGGAYLLASGAGAQLTFARGNVTDNLSTAAMNFTARGGGGLSGGASAGGVLRVVDTTIHDNEAVARGGAAEIFDTGGTVRFTNVTMSGNRSRADGGGLWAVTLMGGTTLIEHSTVTANVADSDASGVGVGGGIFAAGGLIQMHHALVAGNSSNTAASDLGFSPTGTLGSGVGTLLAEFSLVGNNSGSGLAAAPVNAPDANGNIVGGAGAAAIDPMLGPLADNGGPTPTHAPLPGSPAIDAGDPAVAFNPAEFDQRGTPFVRVFDGDGAGGARIDIGSYEVQTTVVLSADFDNDSDTDGADFLTWQRGLGLAGAAATRTNGNADGDLDVDGADLDVWRNSFGAGAVAAAGGQVRRGGLPNATALTPAMVDAAMAYQQMLDQTAPWGPGRKLFPRVR
jgi:hypothetical protein